jgi:hypothetical protein
LPNSENGATNNASDSAEEAISPVSAEEPADEPTNADLSNEANNGQTTDQTESISIDSPDNAKDQPVVYAQPQDEGPTEDEQITEPRDQSSLTTNATSTEQLDTTDKGEVNPDESLSSVGDQTEEPKNDASIGQDADSREPEKPKKSRKPGRPRRRTLPNQPKDAESTPITGQPSSGPKAEPDDTFEEVVKNLQQPNDDSGTEYDEELAGLF